MLLILSLSCNFGSNHYHDGEYVGDMDFFEIRIEINGNEIIVNHSIAGVSKLECKQFKDYIEVVEPGGVKKIIKVLEDGDLEYSDWFTLKKIKSDENDNESVGSEEIKVESLNNKKEVKKETVEQKSKKQKEENGKKGSVLSVEKEEKNRIKELVESIKKGDLPLFFIYEQSFYKYENGVYMVKVEDDWYEVGDIFCCESEEETTPEWVLDETCSH